MSNLQQRLFIGMDGGGTKIKLKVADGSGKVLAQAQAGPAQIRYSVAQAWASINDALNQALGSLGISSDASNVELYACAGLAGCEIQSAQQDFLSQPHCFKELLLYSDAYVACVGAHGGDTGGVVIAGTGVVGLSLINGHPKQVAGWGFPQDDLGGGAWLGLEAFKQCLQSLDGRMPASSLSQSIYEYFGSNQEDMVCWACNANPTLWASLAPLVTASASQGDQFAKGLLKQASSYITQVIDALMPVNYDEAFNVALFGGLSTFIYPHLPERIQKSIIDRKNDAEDGALWLIQKHTRLGVSDE